MKIVVVGGMNMDLIGTPRGKFSLRDSNIGRVTLSPGGVGRNIARQLAYNSVKVSLLTAIGNDQYADMLKEDCKKENIDISHALQADIQTSVYMCILDDRGNMIASINDMALTGSINTLYLAREIGVFKDAKLCVLDANLSSEALLFVAEHAELPLLLDPVSCVKSLRALPLLDKLEAIKPNLIEAQYMSGCEKYEDAADWFLDKGVKRVFISLGENGIYYADSTEKGHIPAIALHDGILLSGAGDAMCAGLAMGLAQNKTTAECAKLGIETAADRIIENDKKSKVEE